MAIALGSQPVRVNVESICKSCFIAVFGGRTLVTTERNYTIGNRCIICGQDKGHIDEE